MSLLPMLFSNWWEELESPHYILDQNFGLALNPDDLSSPPTIPYDSDILVIRPRRRGFRRYQPYDRALARKSTGASTVQADKKKFEVTLDVQQFAPEEVSVKVVDRNVMVEGKHEERKDEHGWISRQFVRKYLVPEQCDIDQLKTTLSSDGVLTIIAPRKEPSPLQKNERVIEIKTTGKPALREETKSTETQKDESATHKDSALQRGQEQTVKAA